MLYKYENFIQPHGICSHHVHPRVCKVLQASRVLLCSADSTLLRPRRLLVVEVKNFELHIYFK